MAKREHGEEKRGVLFDDLSVAQVVAGALAAVTSMLLASQIGIYGSVIGVGVGSVVSAVASQLYKKFLQRSADKLRDLAPGEVLPAMKAGKGGREGGEAAGMGVAAAAGEDAGETSALPVDGRTAVLKTAPVEAGRTPRLRDAAQEGDVTARRALAQRDRKKRVKRGALVVSVVSALAAVAVSAVVVYAVSAGEGVGAKTGPLISTSRSQPSNDGGAAGSSADEGGSPNSTDSGDGAKGDPSKDAGNDTGGQSGSDADGSGSNSDSGSGSTSGDGSGSSGSGSSGGSGDASGGGSGTGGSSGSGDASGGGSGSGGENGSSGNMSDGDSSNGGSGGGSSSGSGSASGTSSNVSSGSGAAVAAGVAAVAAAATMPWLSARWCGCLPHPMDKNAPILYSL